MADDSTAVVLVGDSAAQHMAWTSGQLEFRAAPVSEVLSALTHWYGYQFRTDDPNLTKQNVTVILDAQSGAHALRAIKVLLNVELTFEGDTITIHRRRSRVTPAGAKPDVDEALTPSYTEVGR